MKRFDSFLTLLTISLLTSGFVSGIAVAEDPDKTSSERALKQVTSDIKYLASDELGGRQPGTPGMVLAEKFIVAEYEKAGLVAPYDGTYLQEMEVGETYERNDEVASLVIKGPDGKSMEMKLGENFQQLTGSKNYEISGDLVFVGYGIKSEDHNYDEISPVDIKDKIVVMIRREPQADDEDSVFDGAETSRNAYIMTKVRRCRGAAGIIMINDSSELEGDDPLAEPDQFGRAVRRVPFYHMKRSVFDEMLKTTPILKGDGEKLSTIAEIEKEIDANLSPLSQTMEGWTVEGKGEFKKQGVKTYNIVGVIEGEGPHADETIVIGAHYDHLGMGAYGSRTPERKEVHNGADDNATGTAAVIELARRYAARDTKPARRLVFICFTAEEMGLLGAEHYCKNPLFPMEKTVAMVNFDMIGWLREDKLTIYNWNSCREFGPVLDKANEDFNLDLKKPASGFAGSDHLPFFQRSVPVMFIHTGLTETYHTPDDDFETLDCAGAVKVIDFTESVVDGICGLDAPPKFGTPERVSLGVRLKTEDDVVTIEEVRENSIAERSGLLAGDIIVEFNEEPVTRRREVTRGVRRDAGQTVPIKVKRDGTDIILNVTLSKEVVQ